MSTFTKYRARLTFVGGIAAGVIISLAALDQQLQRAADLQKENQELTEDLFRYRESDIVFDASDLPYGDDADAAEIVATARRQAVDDDKFLMITFGANWCLDCRTLYRHLGSPEVREYTKDTFDFVNVNVGKFNVNADLASELGVDLRRGIPVAIFFDPEGRLIGTTNEGQLEPARFYTSRQILKFVRDIAEKSLIAAPDSVQ
jgi:protein disulfide-isomerase